MTRYGYARVSTKKQLASLDTQVQSLISRGIKPQHVYQDIASGAKKSRPEFDALLRAVDTGDSIEVTKVDRLGRTLVDTMETLADLAERGVVIEADGFGRIDPNDPSSKAMVRMMLVFAELERERLVQRTNEGLAHARAQGKKLGPKFKIDDAQRRRMAAAVASGTTIAQVARDFKVSRSSVYAAIQQFPSEENASTARDNGE